MYVCGKMLRTTRINGCWLDRVIARCRWNSQQAIVSPLARFNELVKAGDLRRDGHQQSVIEQLDRLCTHLQGYQANGQDASPVSFLNRVCTVNVLFTTCMSTSNDAIIEYSTRTVYIDLLAHVVC